MASNFQIESHKAHFHPDRVGLIYSANGDIAKLSKIPPIYVEVSTVGACNHRCTFCAVDYIGYDNHNRLDSSIFLNSIKDMAEFGVRSIMFAGEGEPLLHSKISEFVKCAHDNKIDTAFTTNGVALTKKFVDESIDKISWIKISLNAGTEEDYEKIHRTRKSDFNKVFANLKYATKIKKAKGLEVSIGVQAVLLPENMKNIHNLCLMSREAGADYVVIKPYSHEPSTLSQDYINLSYSDKIYEALEEKLKKYNTDTFQVIYRSQTMKLYDEGNENRYTKCYSTPILMGYIMANGDVYGCKDHLLDPKFEFGNIYSNKFSEIWTGKKKQDSLKYVLNKLETSTCRVNCRLDKVNRYLFSAIEKDVKHINFL